MAHVRKDTLVKCRQWWKHLRDWKRITNKAERQAAIRLINKEINADIYRSDGKFDNKAQD